MISPELKLLHKKPKLLSTVDSVGKDDVILRTPEGDKFIVDNSVLENEYAIE